MGKKQQVTVPTLGEVVDYLKITGQFLPAVHAVAARKKAAEAARRAGIRITVRQLQKAADAFRMANGLTRAKDTEAWLETNGITLEALEDYLETNLLISRFKKRLEKEANKAKYLKSRAVKETVRELIFRDWLEKSLKKESK
ncbi:MAG: hypothetical protein JRF59_16895 [Deltaproteobacteria bacterium]|nr:hypothetical protein [Deltaproteobacteria bacterium]MBW1924031.1 hypothetical protein [Deltaproteobacteria bacterium]MBW1950388.1 hypothetical protein [Deltaproteobacteria bacterium]MBW2008335.1 hypothetical protein [Deltaproteobacteria bacterium]MBW2104050.1 hypothetical protein [Deltaproteobacteria bacterium]